VTTRGQARNGRAARPRAPPNAATVPEWPCELSLENIRHAQNNDPDIAPIMAILNTGSTPADVKYHPSKEVQCYLRQLESLIIDNGVIYRLFLKPNLDLKFKQILVPKSLRELFLKVCHENLAGHAKSPQKVGAIVSRHGYWLQWQTDLRIFLSRCRICLERHVGPLPRHARLRPFIGRIARPGTQASCDLFGPLPACNGYKYCLSYQDRCSRYLSLAPLKNKEGWNCGPRVAKDHVATRFPGHSLLRSRKRVRGRRNTGIARPNGGAAPQELFVQASE
jgi:hypothetical protein